MGAYVPTHIEFVMFKEKYSVWYVSFKDETAALNSFFQFHNQKAVYKDHTIGVSFRNRFIVGRQKKSGCYKKSTESGWIWSKSFHVTLSGFFFFCSCQLNCTSRLACMWCSTLHSFTDIIALDIIHCATLCRHIFYSFRGSFIFLVRYIVITFKKKKNS